MPHLLFTYREVLQLATAFSAFVLLFRQRVRGSPDIVKEAWMSQEWEETPALVSMMEMHEQLQDMSDVVKVATEWVQKWQKANYNQHAKKRVLS